MGFRFFRRTRIAPGITLNLSRSGPSLSLGPPGAKVTVGPRGRRSTVGLPGTGLFYTTTSTSSSRRGSSRRGSRTSRQPSSPPPPPPPVPPEQRLTLGFFRRLITPRDEEDLVDGLRHMLQGHDDDALDVLRKTRRFADGACAAGFLALKLKRYDEAARYLEDARRREADLGRILGKYGVSLAVHLPVTGDISVRISVDRRGVLLALAEVYQALDRRQEAVDCLLAVRDLDPDDLLAKLSLAELLMDTDATEETYCREVVKTASDVINESPVHAAILLYKGKALKGLGLLTAARDALTAGLRRQKDRPPELLRALRYERALVYEELGRPARARAEFEKLYAHAPDYRDVAARLGLG